jgi:hypothetical protein
MNPPESNPPSSKLTRLSRSVNSPESDWDGLDPSSDAAQRADDAGLEPDESVDLDESAGQGKNVADESDSPRDRS